MINTKISTRMNLHPCIWRKFLSFFLSWLLDVCSIPSNKIPSQNLFALWKQINVKEKTRGKEKVNFQHIPPEFGKFVPILSIYYLYCTINKPIDSIFFFFYLFLGIKYWLGAQELGLFIFFWGPSLIEKPSWYSRMCWTCCCSLSLKTCWILSFSIFFLVGEK